MRDRLRLPARLKRALLLCCATAVLIQCAPMMMDDLPQQSMGRITHPDCVLRPQWAVVAPQAAVSKCVRRPAAHRTAALRQSRGFGRAHP